MKAIQTHYDGYHFRSRLEARWAVFFNTLGIEFEYEKEGFDLGRFGAYLPDFWIPSMNSWIEIKPTAEKVAEEIDRLLAFHKMLLQGNNGRLVVIYGNPWPNKYDIYIPKINLLCEKTYEFINCPMCGYVSIDDYMEGFGDGTDAIYCYNCDVNYNSGIDTDTVYVWFHKGLIETKIKGSINRSVKLLNAFNAARSARFEHKRNISYYLTNKGY